MTILKITPHPKVTLQINVRPRITFGLTENGTAIGPPGKSAYEIWLEEGNTGTEQDFLDSLKGAEWVFSSGAKSSFIDAGTFGDISLTNDYVYFCVQSGSAGTAIWKKSIMFQT